MSASVPRAAIGSVVFFFVAPGVVAGVIPWWLSGWTEPAGRAGWWSVLGWILIIAGLCLLIAAFAQFVVEGRGTPAPVAPTEELVVGGLYRFVRNPMYLAVGSIILGQAVLFASWPVVTWFVLFGVSVFSFVTFYEQPTLTERYGDQYLEYRRHVPGWYPRLTPWTPSDGSTTRGART